MAKRRKRRDESRRYSHEWRHEWLRHNLGNSMSLDLERAAAAAGGFHLRVVELEAGTFQRLHEIDLGAIQIQQAGLVHEDLQPVVVVSLVQDVGRVLEGHGVAEPGTAAADYGNPQSAGGGIL